MWDHMRDSTLVPKRHPRNALNARAVHHARATGRVQRIADGGGLYLVVARNGNKTWVLRTVIKGRRCDLGLGSTDQTSLADARDEAARLRRIARAGDDPQAERRREREGIPTFEETARQVHAAEAATFRNEKHKKQWLASLASVFGAFGSRRVSDITRSDVLAALSPTWSNTPETSRRVLQRIVHVCEWAKAKGYYAGENPAHGLTKILPKLKPSRQHHPALPYAAVPEFIQSLRRADATCEAVKLAFEFTILCATRTSEVLNAQWSEIDLSTLTWTIPAARMKAGLEHRVPLSPRCVEILERAKALTDGDLYVFPGRSPNKPLSNMVFLMALRRMERSNITPHGFRSTFRDWAAERTNTPRAVCEAALAHTVRDKTEAAYHRTDLFERRRALMNAWCRFATAKPGAVVSMGSRRRNASEGSTTANKVAR